MSPRLLERTSTKREAICHATRTRSIGKRTPAGIRQFSTAQQRHRENTDAGDRRSHASPRMIHPLPSAAARGTLQPLRPPRRESSHGRHHCHWFVGWRIGRAAADRERPGGEPAGRGVHCAARCAGRSLSPAGDPWPRFDAAGGGRDGEAIRPGRIVVAPPDRHLLLRENQMRLRRGPHENRSRPAIDPLFRSAAAVFNGRTAGVILTGMLNDGSSGLLAIKRCGGATVVQDPADADYPDSCRWSASPAGGGRRRTRCRLHSRNMRVWRTSRSSTCSTAWRRRRCSSTRTGASSTSRERRRLSRPCARDAQRQPAGELPPRTRERILRRTAAVDAAAARHAPEGAGAADPSAGPLPPPDSRRGRQHARPGDDAEVH